MENQVQVMKFSQEQVALIKSQIAPNATTDELALFIYVAKKVGLDPLARQIYCIHRGGRMTIQTGIDGYRVIAQRSGDYAGQSEPEWANVDGSPFPATAKVKVFKFGPKGDRYEAAVGVARWEEYCPMKPPSGMWAKMPHTMLAKVAEALALRKAYPQDLSGIYTTDEMAQADSPVGQVAVEDGTPIAELHEHFMLLLEEYKEIDPVEAEKIHPDKWRGAKTARAYTLALDSLQERIDRAREAQPQ